MLGISLAFNDEARKTRDEHRTLNAKHGCNCMRTMQTVANYTGHSGLHPKGKVQGRCIFLQHRNPCMWKRQVEESHWSSANLWSSQGWSKCRLPKCSHYSMWVQWPVATCNGASGSCTTESGHVQCCVERMCARCTVATGTGTTCLDATWEPSSPCYFIQLTQFSMCCGRTLADGLRRCWSYGLNELAAQCSIIWHPSLLS